MRRRVLIIGIDGGTWRILAPAIEEGHMPFLKSLVVTGASGVLRSTIPAITPAAWAAFQTGTNPGKTGVVDFFGWDKHTSQKLVVSSQRLSDTIWDLVSARGMRVGVVNVPMTFPPKPINGYMITGLFTPSLKSSFTYPPALRDELLSAIPEYQIIQLGDVGKRDVHNEFQKFVEAMVANLDCRARAARHLISKEPLDLLMVHFQATDAVQHQLWGYLDAEHPMFDSDKRSYLFEHIYRELDKRLRAVVEQLNRALDGELLILTVSDHGFQTHRYRVYLANWLAKGGFLRVLGQVPYHSHWIDVLKRIDVLGIRNRLFRSRLRGLADAITSALAIGEVDWASSKVLTLGTCNEGLIYVLGQGSDYWQTVDVLKRQLGTLINPATGEKIASTIYHKTELYQGPQLDLLPDLVVVPTTGYSFTGEYRPTMDLFHKVELGTDYIYGIHEPAGILVANGGGIRPQKLECRIEDIAPTILYYLGVPIPEAMDGRVLMELFEVSFHSANCSVRFETEAGETVLSDTVYSDDEQAAIEARLRGLGYLD